MLRSLIFLILLGSFGFLQAQDNTENLSQYYDLIYQIKVNELETGSKTALGSAFQISADGLVITNYHVISNYVINPDRYEIEYLDQHQQTGKLELITFDVVNDLALLRRTDPPAEFLPIATRDLVKGETLYALGNPKDVGITLVFGAYNGRAELSYKPNIIFSGSLNPGMSGGPTLNTAGEVIGVNVATAGSQLSFLIPIELIQPMLTSADNPLPTSYFKSELVRQIAQFQEKRIGDLIERDWPMTPLGRGMAIREIRPDMQCWGQSNERALDDQFAMILLGCNSADNIYLGERFDTGQIHYSFAFKSTDTLGPYRFHQYLSDNALMPDNSAGRTQVTNFHCEEQYIDPAEYNIESSQNLTILCVRSYKELSGLFDVLFFATVTDNLQSLTAHFTLAGVDQVTAQRFTDKFMRHIRWN